MLRPDADVEAKLTHFTDNYLKPPLDKSLSTELAMQPFHEYYLNSNFKDAHMAGGRIEYVRLFSVVAIFIALMTVSFQAIKAAIANPIKSLRSE